jgi:glycosyltransferase involved in cell wall biosynthesis
MRVVLLTRSLEVGGAERQLTAVARALVAAGDDVAVISMYGGGALSPQVGATGARLYTLDKGARWSIVSPMIRFARALRRERPDVVYSWGPTPNIVALLGKFVWPTRVVWGVRASQLVAEDYDGFVRRLGKFEARLSRRADAVIANSFAGALDALRRGFRPRRLEVIPNAIDVDYFRRDPSARARQRAQWGIADNVVLVGLVARLDYFKDHATFLKAASVAHTRHPAMRFVCVGRGPDAYASHLRHLSSSLALEDVVIWAGEKSEMREVHNALDILCSSSRSSEGFSNVIGEAMATQTPCVVTDVGDARFIVGDAGIVVPPEDAAALADALITLAARIEQGHPIGELGRRRILELFGLPQLLGKTRRALLPDPLEAERSVATVFKGERAPEG